MLLDKEIVKLMVMDYYKIDSYGRPLGRISMYENKGRKFAIYPKDKLGGRVDCEYGLTPTYYAVFEFTSFGLQQVSNWYYRYGNAVKKMLSM